MNGPSLFETRRTVGPFLPTASLAPRRVVVTGVGIATPLGSNLDTFWSAIMQGHSCISPITRLDTSDFPVHIGGRARARPLPARADPQAQRSLHQH
jgi:3-oxoacyl-(acyl-carrier-protein) synthase